MIILLLALLLFAAPAYANSDFEPTQDSSERWGYVDKRGELVINAEYARASDFSEDVALVEEPQNAIFIDTSGKKLFTVDTSNIVAIKPRPFHDGLSTCWTPTGTGFVDKTGAFSIKPKFLMASDFSEGLAAVVGDDNSWGFIDKSGRYIIPPQFAGAHEFSEGLAPVKLGSLWGFIDRSGAFKISPRYVSADSFNDGVAAVLTQNDGATYINPTGQCAIKGQFNSSSSFKDGIALVDIETDSTSRPKYTRRYIDRSGKVLDIAPDTGSYGDGMLPFRKNGLIGFANAKGEQIIAPQYAATGGFSEGLAAVQLNGKWGFIDKSGALVIKPIYDAAYHFLCGRAAVMIRQ